MNERSDLEGMLREWFDDGPSTMPDRVVEVVADRISRRRQRRAWRLLWRETDMNPIVKFGAALAAVLVIAVIGWNLLPGRSGGPGASEAPPSPVASPTASPVPSPTQAWWAGSDPRPCGLPDPCAGELSAGTHSTRSIKPSFTFTVPTGWVNTADWHDLDDYFALVPDTPGNRAAAAKDGDFTRSIVIGAHRLLTGPDCESPLGGTGSSAAEIMTALSAREGLAASEPQTVEIGGLTGRQIDVALEPGWTGTCAGDTTTAAVGLLGGTPARAENRQRIIVLDTPDCGETVEQGQVCAEGGNVTIAVYADRAEDFESFLSVAMPIVDSFEFDLGPAASPS